MTQKQRIKLILSGPKTIKQIADETQVVEPSVRRVLGQGAKRGEFKRIARGVYVLSVGTENRAYIQCANAIESVPELARLGFKADMIFLDIPYRTPATQTTNGNRALKYKTISPADFYVICKAIKEILRTKDSPVIYMYSIAESGNKEMSRYNKMLWLNGFKQVAEGNYYKYNKHKGTRCTNMIGKIIEPEQITVYNLSGKKLDLELEYHLVRPKGYQTEKPEAMIDDIILKTTKPNDMVHDYFAGSGVTVKSCLKNNRSVFAIEINPDVLRDYIFPKVGIDYPVNIS